MSDEADEEEERGGVEWRGGPKKRRDGWMGRDGRRSVVWLAHSARTHRRTIALWTGQGPGRSPRPLSPAGTGGHRTRLSTCPQRTPSRDDLPFLLPFLFRLAPVLLRSSFSFLLSFFFLPSSFLPSSLPPFLPSSFLIPHSSSHPMLISSSSARLILARNSALAARHSPAVRPLFPTVGFIESRPFFLFVCSRVPLSSVCSLLPCFLASLLPCFHAILLYFSASFFTSLLRC